MADEPARRTERTEPEQHTGQQFDDPNRQAVGLEPAWAEGFGGSDTSGGSGPTRRKAASRPAAAAADKPKADAAQDRPAADKADKAD
jgi:hypothetical protein